MALNFVDRFIGQLSSSYTAGGTSLVLTSNTSLLGSSVLPSGACYFYLIVQGEGSNTEEEFLVTNVSGTAPCTLTVTGAQAGTSASNHAANAYAIASALSSGAFTQLKTDWVSQGAIQRIAQVITSGSASSAAFSSIPATFTNLMVAYEARSNNAVSVVGLRVTFNGDTTSGDYTTVCYVLESGGATPAGGTVTPSSVGTFINNIPGSTATSGYAAQGRLWINSYARTVFNKKFHHYGNYAQSGNNDVPILTGGSWTNTAAINAISIQPDSGTFLNGSIFTLYGEP